MRLAIVLLVAGSALTAQGPASKSFVGTVAGFRPESAEVEVRPDEGAAVIARFTPGTLAQKVAPGARDLKGAENIKITDVAIGDRVLVTLEPGTPDVRRIVVMPASDIARHNEADRAEWQKRGVAGIVSGKSGNRITVKTRTMTGETEATITVDEHTSLKRYAPDSVKFTDARAATLADIAVGDQLRARGEKSEDGLKVTAQEIVFGTFVVKAGTIAAVDPETKQITLKELGTNKTLNVALTADSQMKSMPALPGGMGRGMPGAGPPRPSGGTMPGPPGAGPPGPGGDGGARGGMMAGPPGGFDINQMLERMPSIKLDDLKPGSTVVVSSTKPAKADQLTAIMVLANADMLIQMASMMAGRNRGGNNADGFGINGPGMAGGMMSGDLGGLGLTGIIMQ